MDTDQKDVAEAGDASKADEPRSHTLETPTRVVPDPEQYISFAADSRWEPLRHQHQASGILKLRDRQHGVWPHMHASSSVILSACNLSPIGCMAQHQTDGLMPHVLCPLRLHLWP